MAAFEKARERSVGHHDLIAFLPAVKPCRSMSHYATIGGMVVATFCHVPRGQMTSIGVYYLTFIPSFGRKSLAEGL